MKMKIFGRTKIKCKTCGKIFEVIDARKDEAKYCSKECVYNCKERQKMMHRIALKQLKKINAKWGKLKKDPKLEDCLSHEGDRILFDNLKWIEKSNYIERIKLTPAIIDILKFEFNEETIFIKYKHFNPHYHEFKIYDRTIPKAFSFSDTGFCYFLGLWIGDRMRVGLSNSNKQLLEYTKNFLESGLKQPLELILGEILYTAGVDPQKVEEAEEFLHSIGITKIRKRIDKGGHLPNKSKPTLSYNICLSNNYVLFHLLCYLKRKLWECTKLMDPKARFAFYAGLIDAEAHIDPIHRTIDVFQSDKCFIDNLSQQLESDDFTARAAKRFVRIYINKKYQNNLVLANELLHYIKHPNKISTLRNILDGNFVKKTYVLIVNWINLFPDKTSAEVALKFGQNEDYFVYHKLTQLVNQDFIKRYKTEKKGKFRYAITRKGSAWLLSNKELIKEKLSEIITYGGANQGMYSSDTEAIKELIKENHLPAYSLAQTRCSN